jgi:2-aminoadipate transaminase
MQFEKSFSKDADSLRSSPIRAFAALINDPKIISFAGGAPSPETFPAANLAELARRVIAEEKNVALQYGPTRGLARLRECVANISESRGIRSSADEVMITSGSQQALDLIARALLDPGDVVLVELPTYIGGSAAFFARRAELAGVAQDDDGIVPESLDEVATRHRGAGRRVKLLYTIPNFQNPSGRLMSPARRRAVIELARKHDFAIIEDDPYGELVFDSAADTMPMKAGEESGHVIYLSSFSKVLAPGLRCGWMIADPILLRRVEMAKESADLCSGMLDQAIVAAYCASGELPQQIGRVRDFYRARRSVLLDALEQRFGSRARWTNARGGLFTFVTLPDGTDAEAMLPKAIEAGVAYIPGASFFVDGSGQNTMRLTFAKETDERMRDGVARLARLFFS